MEDTNQYLRQLLAQQQQDGKRSMIVCSLNSSHFWTRDFFPSVLQKSDFFHFSRAHCFFLGCV